MKKLLLPTLIMASTNTLAAPFNAYEARSMAMGDTGVAHATPASAPLFNPAMLSHGRSEKDYDFSMIIPNISANAIADKDAREGFENIADDGYMDDIKSSIDSFNSGTPAEKQASAKTLAESTSKFADDLDSLADKPITTNISGLVSIAVPNETISVAVFANSSVTLEAIPSISQCDRGLIRAYNEVAEEASNGGTPGAKTVCGNQVFDGTNFNDPRAQNFFTSSFSAVAVQLNEYGITFAKPFDIAGQKVSFGITPKYQSVTSMFVNPTITELDQDSYDINDELEESERTDNTFNMDIGAATNFFDESLALGLTIKNLVGKTYQTAPQNGQTLSYKIKPQARAGLAWNLPMGLLVAADLDLTKNDAYFSDQASRYLGAGIEWDIFNTLRVRTGARSNLENSDDTAFTAGFGINIIAFHIDVTGQISDNNAGVAAQIGIEF